MSWPTAPWYPGQLLLTGNHEGADVDVPDEVLELIFKAQRYKVEVNGDVMTYEELSSAPSDVAAN